MSDVKRLKLTLMKSLIGRLPKHKAIMKILGLRRIRQSIEVTATPSTMGMVNKVAYLLKVEECG